MFLAFLLALQATSSPACPDGMSQSPCPGLVFFDSGETEFRRDWEPVIDEAAKAALARGGRLAVTGHSDTPGSVATNLRMSRARAERVRDALIARGVPAARITVAAEGEGALLIPTAEGVREIQNRRVTIRLLP